MAGNIDTRRKLAPALRWAARIWSVASIVLVLGFIIGEGFNPSGLNEWIGVLLFPIGISIGMILAWWWEGAGGCVTVGCLVAFYAVHLVTAGRFPKGWAYLVFAAPGFLFVLYSRLSQRSRVLTA